MFFAIFVLFSYCSDYPRDLPSFPTRRSSDLALRRSAALRGCALGRAFAGVAFHAGPYSRGRISRSEEHTSELQSRRDVVCRLLLEKKKDIGTFERPTRWSNRAQTVYQRCLLM